MDMNLSTLHNRPLTLIKKGFHTEFLNYSHNWISKSFRPILGIIHQIKLTAKLTSGKT